MANLSQDGMLEIQKDKAFQRNELLANGLSFEEAKRMVSGEFRNFRHAFIKGVRVSTGAVPEGGRQSRRSMQSESIGPGGGKT